MTTIDFLINLKIIKNCSNLNRADKKYVYKLKEEEISISTYYKMWMTCLNEVFIKIKKEFSDRNAKLINPLLLDLFSEYLDIEDEKTRFVVFVPENETMDNWTILGSLVSYKKTKAPNIDIIIKSYEEIFLKEEPSAKLTILEK